MELLRVVRDNESIYHYPGEVVRPIGCFKRADFDEHKLIKVQFCNNGNTGIVFPEEVES